MASTFKQLVQVPPPVQPVVEANGRMNKDWYAYFKELDRHVREIEERLTAGGL